MVTTINHTHNLISSQFPAIYRENGELFVSFMEYYYELIDELDNNFRQGFIVGDIDLAFEKFLIFYKNKYLDSVPVNIDDDFRFIVKHIQDLYRRKGTEESIRLLFQLFFNEEIELFYPSSAILRASDSIYGSNYYLEMEPVFSVRDYPIRRGDFILGERTRSTAFVDSVVFRNLNGARVPIVYLSSKRGEFTIDDSLLITRGNTTPVLYKRPISGSMSNCEVLSGVQPGAKVGDLLDVVSGQYGFLGKVLVTKVSNFSTTTIGISLEDGGYGYTLTPTETLISDQSLVLKSGEVLEGFIEPLTDIDAAASTLFYSSDDTPVTNTNVTGNARLIEYENNVLYTVSDGGDVNNSFLIEVDGVSVDEIPNGQYIKVNINGVGEFKITEVSTFNISAGYEIALLTNSETVRLTSDIIQPFANTQLNSSDYGMSGTIEPETLTTRLRDAFDTTEYTIGEIGAITVTNDGAEYLSDIRGIVKQEEIFQFEKRIVGIEFAPGTNPIIQQDEIVEQDQFLFNLTYPDGQNYTSKAKFIERVGDVYYFKYISFYGFDDDIPLVIRSQEYNINRITEDVNTRAMGLNSRITGDTTFRSGSVEEVKIADTGFKYIDGEIVSLKSGDVTYATARIKVRGTGFTLGEWKTETSFLNNSSKFLRDNDYYQEYSYDVSSVISPEDYDKLVDDIVHVSGTKRFSSPLINSLNNAQVELDISIEAFNISVVNFITEDGSNNMVSETGVQLVASLESSNGTSVVLVSQ